MSVFLVCGKICQKFFEFIVSLFKFLIYMFFEEVLLVLSFIVDGVVLGGFGVVFFGFISMDVFIGEFGVFGVVGFFDDVVIYIYLVIVVFVSEYKGVSFWWWNVVWLLVCEFKFGCELF